MPLICCWRSRESCKGFGLPRRTSPAEVATKWAEIDLAAIRHNAGLIKDLVGPSTAVMAVVKADGYGHGAVPVAKAALAGGASWLGVSSVEEGLELRQAGIAQPILNLGYTPPDAFAAAAEADLSLTVYESRSLELLGGLRPARPVRVHVKVNTGMHRLGAAADDVMALVLALRDAAHLQLEGLWTHFADAEGDPAFTREQLARYLRVRQRIQAEGASGFISHAANSAGLLRVPESRFDMVRAGLTVYGISPLRDSADLPPLRPALRWRTLVTNVQTIQPGDTVGYGRTFRATAQTRIATLAVGYADGLHRRLSNRGKVIIRGRLAPIVGTISMDQTTVDISAIPGVAIGDTACLIGEENGTRWEARDVAEAADTIPYEVLCAISARVPRRYLHHGELE